MSTLLIEKYKPSSLDDIVGNEDTINSLKKSIEKNIFTSLIFYGDIGIGKTSTALCFAKEIVKSRDNVLSIMLTMIEIKAVLKLKW